MNAHITLQFDYTQLTKDANWTYIGRSEDVQDVFRTSYVRSIYVLCLLGSPLVWMCHSRTLTNKTNKVDEQALRIIYNMNNM